MAALFQYTRLAHQSQAVQSIAAVFADVNFVSPTGNQANPVFVPALSTKTLRQNITQTRRTTMATSRPKKDGRLKTPTTFQSTTEFAHAERELHPDSFPNQNQWAVLSTIDFKHEIGLCLR